MGLLFFQRHQPGAKYRALANRCIDGNLATHIKRLSKAAFIGVKKSFIDKKPNTRYFITPKGRTAFEQHLNALENIINAQKL